MENKIQERKNLIKNSIKLLESILKNYGIQKESEPVLFIQNRIEVYKRELQTDY